MTYSTVNDGLALLGRVGQLSASTSPTLAQAAALNEGVSAQIDNALSSNGLAVPVTSPSSLVSYLGLVNSWGLAWQVQKALNPDAAGPVKDKSYVVWMNAYNDALKRLYAGEGLDTAANATILPGGYFVSYPDENVSLGDQAEPAFLGGQTF